jgi:hypothetical protein
MESPAAPARTSSRPLAEPLRHRAIAWLARHWFWLLFAGGIVANLVPLVLAPILPMSDVNGLEGMVGVLMHRHDPAVHTERYFDVHMHVSPNAFSFAFVFVLSHLMPVTAAANVFLAVFAVIGLPCALLYTLRACGHDGRLALFAVAATYHRCVWFGFLGSVAGATLLVLQLGLMTAAFSRARASWRDVALAVTLLLLAASHAFLYAVGAALFVSWAVLATGQPSRVFRRWAPVLPSLAYLGPWLRHTFMADGRAGGGLGHFAKHLWQMRPGVAVYLENLHEWFLDAYAGPSDEIVAGVFVAALAALLVRGIRPTDDGETVVSASPSPQVAPDAPPRPDERGWARAWASRHPLTAAGLVLGYFLLPMSIRQPFDWWAVNVRLIVPALMTLVLLVPRRARGLPGAVMAPVGMAALGYALVIAADFHAWWMPVEIAGLRASIAQIPPGHSVHFVGPRVADERHYRHFPMGHIVDQYLVEKGGNATPVMSSLPGDMWAAWKPVVAASWGDHTVFSWARHATGWDYFLVKQPAPGNGARFQPFPDAPPGAVAPTFEQGLWSVWRKQPAP